MALLKHIPLFISFHQESSPYSGVQPPDLNRFLKISPSDDFNGCLDTAPALADVPSAPIP